MTYSSAAAVRTRTGVQPGDLGLESDEQVDTFLGELLAEVADLMNRRMRYAYDEEVEDPAEIPAGLHGIAADIAADSVREMMVTRQTPVLRVDDFAVRTITGRIFSPDIEKRIRLYSRAAAGEIDLAVEWPSANPPDVDTALFLLQDQ